MVGPPPDTVLLDVEGGGAHRLDVAVKKADVGCARVPVFRSPLAARLIYLSIGHPRAAVLAVLNADALRPVLDSEIVGAIHLAGIRHEHRLRRLGDRREGITDTVVVIVTAVRHAGTQAVARAV